MPQAPVLRNTCHGPRTSIPQRVGCLPPHTDRVQQDIRPTDSPAPSAQKSENTTKGAMSKLTANEDDPRAQHGAYRVFFVYSVFFFLARPPSPFLQAFLSGGLFFLFCFFSRTVTLHLSPLPAARQNGAIDLQGDQNYVSTHVYLVHMYT